MTLHHPLALAAALLALAPIASAADAGGDPPTARAPAAADGPHPAAPQEGSAGQTLATLDGVVRAVDLARHEVTIDVDGKAVVLGIDRNTLVYLPAGLSTLFALRPGDVVRAGRNGAYQAYWVQVRSSPAGAGATPSTPGQGTGPGGGAAPPQEGAAPAPATR